MYRLSNQVITAARQGKVTKSRDYNTELGTFIIYTTEVKRRGRDYMGRPQKTWQTYTFTEGYFEDYKDCITFFIERDGRDTYVSSSEGRDSDRFIDAIGANSYDDMLNICDEIVVKCFQDYYQDPSIR